MFVTSSSLHFRKDVEYCTQRSRRQNALKVQREACFLEYDLSY